VVIEGESYVLALLYSNITFHLTFIKPFYIGDIKASSNSPKYNPEYYIEGEDDGEGNSSVGIIPPTISTNISLKRGRGQPYKNPNIIVFL
jgi:hypothetical protein